MTEPAFLPSQVFLTPIPLVGTFGRTEREIAAAMLVRACAFHGDRWQPLTPPQMGEWLKHDLDNKIEPFSSLDRNPFARPDFRDLIREGYAEGTLETGSPLTLTQKAISALAKWVRTTPHVGDSGGVK